MFRNERFVLVRFGEEKVAIEIGHLERVVRQPSSRPWLGKGSVRAWCPVDGWLVWILDPPSLFADVPRQASLGREWLIILKANDGLTRMGLFVDDVKGPYGSDRINGHRVIQRRSQ